MPAIHPATFAGFPFDGDVFTSYVNQPDPVNPQLIKSGVIQRLDPAIASALSEKNFRVTIPFYSAFEGDALNYDGETANTPVTLKANSMSACGYRRMKAWKEDDFTHELTGSNGLQNMAMHVGEYQAKQNQKVLLSIIKGIEGETNFKKNHVNDYTAELASAKAEAVAEKNALTAAKAIAAMQKALGDHQGEFKVWFMHSAVFTDLCQQNLAQNFATMENAQTQNPYDGVFLGKPVIVDDNLTVTMTGTSGDIPVYDTYLMGTGAFVTAPVRIDTPNYVDYDPETNGGVNKLYTKWGRLIHPYGFSAKTEKFSKYSPTNTEFATASNWEMKYDSKNIPIAIFKTAVPARV